MLRIKKFIKPGQDFINVNYNILPMVSVKNVVEGELESVSYYMNYNFTEKTGDLAVKETLTYTRVSNYLVQRKKVIEWYNYDGSIGYAKKMFKTYSMAEAIEAGKKKRNMMIGELKGQTILYLVETESISVGEAELLGGQFIVPNNDNIGMYIIGVKDPLLSAITNSTLAWMDNDTGAGVTIRNYMTNYLS